MKPEEYSWDWARILWGEYPPLLFLEVAMRTVIIYLYTLLLVRLVGKRGIGQFTPFDFVIIIALGSAVGDPMFYPEVSLAHTMLVITVVVLMTRGVAILSERSVPVDRLISGTPKRLVVDGRLELESMDKEEISREEIFDALRGNGVQQLGQVERAYLEPSGKLSPFLYPEGEARAGLPILPSPENQEQPEYHAPDLTPFPGSYSCTRCGLTRHFAENTTLSPCPYCQNKDYARSVRTLKEQLYPESRAERLAR